MKCVCVTDCIEMFVFVLSQYIFKFVNIILLHSVGLYAIEMFGIHDRCEVDFDF
jgi:hypothetical protein